MARKLNIVTMVIVSTVFAQLITSCVSKPMKGEVQYNKMMGDTYSSEKDSQILKQAISGDQNAIDAMCFSETKYNIGYSDGSSFCDSEKLPVFSKDYFKDDVEKTPDEIK
mgnify:FL=1